MFPEPMFPGTYVPRCRGSTAHLLDVVIGIGIQSELLKKKKIQVCTLRARAHTSMRVRDGAHVCVCVCERACASACECARGGLAYV